MPLIRLYNRSAQIVVRAGSLRQGKKKELGLSLKESDFQLFRDSAHGCDRAAADLT
jgi:hypothetical protein